MHAPVSQVKCLSSRPTVEPLVNRYRESSPFFFASHEQTLLAQAEHVQSRVSLPGDQDLGAFAREQLQQLERAGVDDARLALALPFSPRDSARGFLLSRSESAPGRQLSGPQERASLEGQAGYAVSFDPSPQRYVEAVTSALARIAGGELEKVVLSRILELRFLDRVDGAEWLRRFHAQNAGGYVFAIDLAQPGEPVRKLMGASPELLLRKHGAEVLSNPLAGSRPRGRNPAEDQDNARALLNSEKDHREHALVVDAVAAALRPFCRELTVPERPSLLSTPTMWHLSSAIHGELRDPRCMSVELAQALHPTPAVAGYPRERATALIAELESGARGWFAGAVGHCDAQGDGEWAVSLRCAEMTERSARLFAGAGVVAQSDPWAELDETGAKLRTALRALGVPLLSGAG